MFRAQYLSELTKGRSKEYLSLSTDSRIYTNEDVFWCLDGPSFKGSDYIESVYKKKCRLFVLNKKHFNENFPQQYPEASFLAVDDSLAYLQNLALKCIEGEKNQGLQVIGITGSNGKTTCKEIMTLMLNILFGLDCISSTWRNFNNQIGVPLTILSMKKETLFLIVEMGTNHPGEMTPLCRICKPDAGFITNIGFSHLEFFGNKEGVLKEKAVLYDSIKKHSKNPLILLNEDDEMLARLNNEAITFSKHKKSSYNYNIDSSGIHVSGQREFTIKNPYIKEDFNLVNLLQCTLLLTHLLPKRVHDVLKASETIALPKGNRSTWKDKRGTRIFLDAYNANPSSMEASLTSFNKSCANIDPEKILIVLGDMNELGEKACDYHKEIGELTKKLGLRHIYFVGRYAKFYKSGNSEGIAFASVSELAKKWNQTMHRYDSIFLKASRSLMLESLLEN